MAVLLPRHRVRRTLGRVPGGVSVQCSVRVSSFGVHVVRIHNTSRMAIITSGAAALALVPFMLGIQHAKAYFRLNNFDFFPKLWLQIGVTTEVECVMIPWDIDCAVVWLLAAHIVKVLSLMFSSFVLFYVRLSIGDG